MDSKIEWIEEFSVNNPKIDDQHKEIFELINCFINENTIRPKSSALAEILSKLTDYSRIHFGEEEQYMKEHNFRYISEHRREHSLYIKKVALFNMNFYELNPTNPSEVSDFLVDWWKNHIIKQDQRYKLFIEKLYEKR